MNRREFQLLMASLAFSSPTGWALAAKPAQSSKPLLVAASKKPGGEWIEYPTQTIADLKGFQEKKREYNRYGGIAGKKTKKIGFWHVERHDGRFWLVDPEGGLNIHRAVCSVGPGGGERNKKAFEEKFKTRDAWAEATAQLLRDHGFNGTGSWSSDLFRKTAMQKTQPLALTINLNLMARYGKKRGGTYMKPGHLGYPNDCIFAFDPEFPDFCDQSVAEQVKNLKDDPNILGYFTDNEMPLRKKSLENYLSIENKDDPGRVAAEKWLAGKEKTREQIDETLRLEFLAYMVECYMKAVTAAIRKHAPNQLILGPRLHSTDLDVKPLMQAVGKYVDIISFNYYGVWTPLEKHTKGWTEWTGKPFMITEWYTKGADSGLANTTGAGWVVKTQKDRGLFYQNYTLALLECGNCVGWHWFKYLDNDPTAKGVDPSNIDGNKGIVDNDYVPYADLVSQMKTINENVFDLIDFFDR